MTGSAITVTGRRWHSNQPSLGRQVHKESAILQAFKGDSEHQIPCTVKISVEIDRRQRALRLARGQSPPRSLSCSYVPRQPSTGARQVRVKDQVLLDSLLVV